MFMEFASLFESFSLLVGVTSFGILVPVYDKHKFSMKSKWVNFVPGIGVGTW